MLDKVKDHLSTTTTHAGAIEKLYVNTNILCRTFGFFYSLTFAGLVLVMMNRSENAMMMAALLAGAGSIIGCIGMNMYARGLNTFLKTDTPQPGD
jgi:hypothetical protein